MKERSKLAALPAYELPGFKEKHSAAIRVWHWVFFLSLTASLVMVLMASTVFRTRNTISLVQQQLQEKGVVIGADQARGVAHEYSDRLWDLHRIFGYILAALLMSRLVIELVQPHGERFAVRMRRTIGFAGKATATNEEKSEIKHYLGVKVGYLTFYLLILVMAVTGLGLAFEGVPFLQHIRKPIKEVHSIVQYGIYAYLLLHLFGVIRADLGRYPGLVSGMINGKKR